MEQSFQRQRSRAYRKPTGKVTQGEVGAHVGTATAKPVRETDEDYLEWLRRQPCAIGRMCDGAVESSHLRTRGAGGSDLLAISHCRKHHALWHSMGRKSFDTKYGDQLFLAAAYRARYERGLNGGGISTDS